MTVEQLFQLAFAMTVLAVALIVLRRNAVIRGRVSLSPLVLFLTIDLLAVWFALSPWGEVEGASLDTFEVAAWGTGALMTGLAAAMVLHRQTPSPIFADFTSLRRRRGTPLIAALGIAAMCGVSVLESGIPSVGGIVSGLLDPVDNADVLAEVRETRRDISKGHVFGGQYRGQGVIRALGEVGWRYFLCLIWLVALIRGSAVHRRRAIVASLLALVLLAGAGVRSNLIFVFVVVLVGFACARRLEPRLALLSGSALFGLLVIIGPLSKGPRGFESFSARVASSMSRVVSGNGTNTVGLINLIDEGQMEVGGGSVISERLQAALPGVPAAERPFANRLAIELGASESTTTYATPTQIGLFYADFRVIGVVIGSFITGFALYWVHRVLGSYLSAGVSETRLAFAATATFMAGYVVVTGPTGFMANMLLLCVLHGAVTFAERLLGVEVGESEATQRAPSTSIATLV